jgi:hypothetical protein
VSAAGLERLAAARAFKPMEAFDELADNHVDFDKLLGGKRREAALAEALQGTAPARVAVLGPSGSGKSSLIAATLADLPAFLPLSIAIGQADVGILENQARFGQFVVRELSRQAKGRFAAQQKVGRRREAALARLVADATTRTGPGGKLALNIGIPNYAALSTEIRSAIKSTESDLNPSQSLEGLEEIARVFSAPERPVPVLIIDDADKWAGSPVPEHRGHRGVLAGRRRHRCSCARQSRGAWLEAVAVCERVIAHPRLNHVLQLCYVVLQSLEQETERCHGPNARSRFPHGSPLSSSTCSTPAANASASQRHGWLSA